MNYFNDNIAAMSAMTRFTARHGGVLSDEDFDKLVELQSTPSIVDAVVQVSEFLYSRWEQLPKEGKVLIAQLSDYRAKNGWHRDPDTNTSARALSIQYAMMKEAGEPKPTGVTYPAKADYPTPLPAYAPPPEVTAEEPPAPTEDA